MRFEELAHFHIGQKVIITNRDGLIMVGNLTGFVYEPEVVERHWFRTSTRPATKRIKLDSATQWANAEGVNFDFPGHSASGPYKRLINAGRT